MVFIAYDHNGYVTSIVSAKSEELAKAWWHGAGVDVYTSKNLENVANFTPLDQHPTGVIPLLKTETKNLSSFGGNTNKYVVVAKI